MLKLMAEAGILGRPWLAVALKAVVLIVVLVFGLYVSFLRPPKYPRGVPAVPFWVVLLPFFSDVDQEDTFKNYIREPLLKHGAVKIFFGAQWNILFQRPEYLGEIFRGEDVFQKSGNQKKIPHSVLAEFLGDNIISAHGSAWKHYQQVVKPGLQKNFEVETTLSNASQLCGLIRSAQADVGSNKGIPVQELLQRYTIANAAQNLHQTDFGTLENPSSRLNILQAAVKAQIFKPVFMNFPVLDRFPIKSRQRARDLVGEFSAELQKTLRASHHHDGKPCEMASDRLGCRLLAAHHEGLLSDQQLRDNLNVTFVAGQENPQLALISTMYLLGKHTQVQGRLRRVLSSVRPTASELAQVPLLTAVALESLRMFPPIGQLINRRASKAAFLGLHEETPIHIPEGTYVGYNCYATNRDPGAWEDPDSFLPSRWGDTMEDINKRYRDAKRKAEFITFHGGRRACLGERFALLQLRATLFVLLGQLEWELDPSWPDRMTPVSNTHPLAPLKMCLSLTLWGAFAPLVVQAGPLYPRQLRLRFRAADRVVVGGVGGEGVAA